jgi:ubiquitin carboxyl-terminal hydrolase 1
VTCEMCSLRATLQYYQSESARLSLPPNKAHLNGHASPSTPSGSFSVLQNLPNIDSSGVVSDKRKKKAKEARKIVTRLQEMVDSNTVSHYGEAIPVPGQNDLTIKWQKHNADAIREGILTRPPPTLRVHLDRSGFTPYGQLVKKSARVAFPLILDLTPFVAKGVWQERSDLKDILSASPAASGPRVLYRLESAILHYGYTTHSGHFICIRRKPSNLGTHHGPTRASKSCADGCRCESCLFFGPVRGGQSVPGKGWLRVSDDEIEEVGEEALIDARAAVFMLFYERVDDYTQPEGENRESKDSRIMGKL